VSKFFVDFVKSLVYQVVTLLRGGNEKREARRFTKAQKQRPQDYAMYVVDTEIDFEIAPIEFYRPHPRVAWGGSYITIYRALSSHTHLASGFTMCSGN
jgi:hypothetical protein